jgi:serine-type D-Ala-D-Ala carboxypeptidase/endopeptidase (penicillin-binding protein 4)
MDPMQPTRRVALLARALAGAALLGLLTAPVAAAQPVDPQVDALLQQRLANPRIGGNVGMVVVDAATGDVVSQHDADRLMLPASNMKLVTAVTALTALGGQATFSTRVRAGATPADLVLEGGGDPLLSTSDLQRLARRTARAIPHDVPVTVHVDTDLFPATGRAPGWPADYIPSSAATVEALARLGDYSRDPSAGAAAAFVQQLRRQGVPVQLGADADGGAAPVLAEVSRHTVADAVAVMLSHSENNVAEVLFRQVAVAGGLPATWDGAETAAVRTLTSLGLAPEGMTLLDGSGLSRKDRVSPKFLVDVLRLARVTKPGPYAAMFEPQALPVAGQTGTLATAFGRYVTKHARCAVGDVHAKTGSLFDTISLSGVAATESGGERLFSILVNDRPRRFSALSTRQALDGLTATMTGCWKGRAAG